MDVNGIEYDRGSQFMTRQSARVMKELWKLAVSHFRLTRVLKLWGAQGVTAISHNSGIKVELSASYEVLLLVTLIPIREYR